MSKTFICEGSAGDDDSRDAGILEDGCLMFFTSAGSAARRGSSGEITEYQGRLDVSRPDTTSDSARVVSIPSAHIASDAKNSRTELRSTARPSPPRQKVVVPPPFSCISHRCSSTTTWADDTRRRCELSLRLARP